MTEAATKEGQESRQNKRMYDRMGEEVHLKSLNNAVNACLISVGRQAIIQNRGEHMNQRGTHDLSLASAARRKEYHERVRELLPKAV